MRRRRTGIRTLAVEQLLFNGLSLGAAYALVALGFVLVLNATSAVNFAQGDMVMVGGFTAVALAGWLPGPGIILIPFVFVLMAILGLAFSLLAYFPLKDRPVVSIFISTIAFGIILQNSANTVFGPEPRAAPPLFAGGYLELGDLILSRQSIAIIIVAGLVIAGQQLLFNRTQFGRKLRATAQDREMARAVGIRVNWMIAATFGISSALAGIAGLLLAHQFFVTPTEGFNLIVKAYIAVAVGGWGSVAGAVLGALLIALFEVIVSAYISYTAATTILYLTVLWILFFRPQGLFGEVVQRRA